MRKAFYTTMFGGVVDIIRAVSNKITNRLYNPKNLFCISENGFSVLNKINRVINVESTGKVSIYLIKSPVVSKTIQ